MKCLKTLMFFALLSPIAASAQVESRMDFGMQMVGSERSKDMLLTNYSSGTIYDISHTITGQGFSVNSDCPKQLRSGLSCRYRLTLTCNREGYQDGVFEIFTSDKNYRVILSGYCNPL
ncbi:hypothetical protein [Bdellovibrio bacteriovorus]|uniref:Uncharacterized protein n=1 Tax=Bdellovibrio bacteriovorus TaxID=959 RepID=A0A1Z3NA77_BDEBC|nr:hypothetical protein [Bdellovibrio bacteriovorus]ASD64356.1 hypothetical protein B9G79_12660 [Bdellovibrio bacteriovorus]